MGVRSLFNSYGRMHVRTQSRALNNDDVKALQHIWHEARRMRLPLNVFLSVKPENSDTMTVEALCTLFDRIKNLYGEFARRHRFKITYLWVRESLADGTREHLHMLCHVPKPHQERFFALANDWMPLPSEMDVRPASQVVRRMSRGKQGSALGYLVKNMTSQAAYRRPYIWKKGGPIMGHRWGCSRNLKARLAVL